jgi:hypothetical protein
LDWIDDALIKFNEALRDPFTSGWMPTEPSPPRLRPTEKPSATNYVTTTETFTTGVINFKRGKT